MRAGLGAASARSAQAWTGLSAPRGTTSARSLACAASTPWNRIRCKRGRGTNAARRGGGALSSLLESPQEPQRRQSLDPRPDSRPDIVKSRPWAGAACPELADTVWLTGVGSRFSKSSDRQRRDNALAIEPRY